MENAEIATVCRSWSGSRRRDRGGAEGGGKGWWLEGVGWGVAGVGGGGGDEHCGQAEWRCESGRRSSDEGSDTIDASPPSPSSLRTGVKDCH